MRLAHLAKCFNVHVLLGVCSTLPSRITTERVADVNQWTIFPRGPSKIKSTSLAQQAPDPMYVSPSMIWFRFMVSQQRNGALHDNRAAVIVQTYLH